MPECDQCPHCGAAITDEDLACDEDAQCESCGSGVVLSEADVHEASGAWICPHCDHLNM